MKIYGEFYCEIEDALNPMEIFFKNLYRNQKKRSLELPHRFEEIKDIIQLATAESTMFSQEMLTESLLEENFFLKDQDVSIYLHSRYMPAMIHTHDFFEIACLLHGTCVNYILNQKIDMIPGDICILAPNTEHAISGYNDECLMLNFLIRTSTFEKAFFGALSDIDILSNFFLRTLYKSKEHPFLYFRTGDDTEIKYTIASAYLENSKNRRYKSRMINSIVNTFFITLLRDHEKDIIFRINNGSELDENLIFLLRYMQEHYKTLTLKQLADFFNYSERQLQRIIKAYTGMNFSQNIQKMKMKQAANLLKSNELSVVEIAERTGYNDISNFRHIFKNYYHMTPKEYRNLNK